MQNTSTTPLSSMETKPGGSKGIIIFFVVIVLIVLAVCAFLGYRILFGSSDSGDSGAKTTPTPTTSTSTSTTTTPTSSVSPTPTEPAAEIPAGWEAVDNTKCGFTAYRPKGWHYRLFENCAMGLDPNPIPTASEYWGAVAIFKETGTVATAVANLKSNLDAGATETSATIAGRDWVIVEGTLSGGGVFDDQQVKAGFISANGKTYKVASQLIPASFALYEDELDKQMEIIVFN